jgi:hypothetical protein
MPKKRTSDPDFTMSSGAAPARRKPTVRPRVLRSTTSAEATTAAAPATLAATVGGPTFDQISRLAYSYWEARGCQGGNPDEDWIRAERELRGEL